VIPTAARNHGARNHGARNPGARNPGARNPGVRNPGISLKSLISINPGFFGTVSAKKIFKIINVFL
jgi:hypothetical protein